MTEILVRRAKREDCPAIIELIQELADYEKMSDGPQLNCETLERDGFDGHPLFFCNVATCNEKIIGYAFFYYTYSTWIGKAMYLEDLYVTSEFRGKHVGSTLLKAVAKEAVENNCCKLDLIVLKWNPAQEFYKKYGANDVTVKEQWHCYRIDDAELVKLASDA